MAKIVIELTDTAIGRCDVKCSEPWTALQAKRAQRALTPGAEQLTWVAVNAIQQFVAAEAKRLFGKRGARQ